MRTYGSQAKDQVMTRKRKDNEYPECEQRWVYFALITAAVFIRLAYADRSYERELLGRVPHGH